MSLVAFHPSHTVLFGAIDTATERAATADAIGAAAEHADRICARIDCEGVGEEYPALVDRLRAEYDHVESIGAGYDEYCATGATGRDVLRELLAVETWHLAVYVQHVRLERDRDTFLLYNADHRQFDIDGGAVPDALNAIEEAFGEINAGVLPNRSLCEWETDGTTYDLSPPSLCVDNACFGLTALRDVNANAESMTIHLEWDDSQPSNRVLATMIRLFERLGPSRPTELQFESFEEFQNAKAAFETVLSALR